MDRSTAPLGETDRDGGAAVPRTSFTTRARAYLRSLRFLPALLAPLAMPVQAWAGDLTVGGTGAGLGIMHLMAEAYAGSPGADRVNVLPSLGSSGGIRALGDGAIDLAVSGRPLKEKERKKDLVDSPLARTPFVFVVPPQVTVDGLTLDEAAAIYAQKTATWPDGQPIRLILRPANDSDSKLLKSLSPAIDRAVAAAETAAGMVVANTDQENLDAVETVPGALGGSSLGQVLAERRRLKVLTLDGVRPSPENLAGGRYAAEKTLYLVTRAQVPPAVRKFVEFCRSPEGRRILSQNGYLAH